MYRRGIVHEVDPATHRVRVRFTDRDGLVSPWLDVAVRDAHDDKEYSLPSKDAQVAVIMDEHDETGCVLGAIYSNADKPAASSETIRRWDFADGGVIQYDRSTGELLIKVPGFTNVGEGGELVALSTLVDSAISTIVSAFNAHTHPTGVGPSGPPAAPITPAPDSVACTKMKAL